MSEPTIDRKTAEEHTINTWRPPAMSDTPRKRIHAPTVSVDPVLEIAARKLSGYGNVPPFEQARMIKRAVKAIAEHYERENEELRQQLSQMDDERLAWKREAELRGEGIAAMRQDRERLHLALVRCEDLFYQVRVLPKEKIIERAVSIRDEIASLNSDVAMRHASSKQSAGAKR